MQVKLVRSIFSLEKSQKVMEGQRRSWKIMEGYAYKVSKVMKKYTDRWKDRRRGSKFQQSDWTDRLMDGRMDGQTDRWMDGWIWSIQGQ